MLTISERPQGCDGHRTRHIQKRFHCPCRDSQPPQPEGWRQIYKVGAVGTHHPQYGYGKACQIPFHSVLSVKHIGIVKRARW